MTIRSEVIDEADIILLQGGEMPEVAMYESLEQLKREGRILVEEELDALRQAVFGRYRDIIFRDLRLENLTESIFRGPKRAWINLGRLISFSEKYGLDYKDLLAEVGGMLVHYLKVEDEAAASGRTYNTLGMDRVDIEAFIELVGPSAKEGLLFLDRVCALPTLEFKKAIAASRRSRKGLKSPR